ncbi:hypothetical protein ON010_g13343 [Phytophthora cinnamomi]|nr:hypothetical protein ON010_g13343 [Phytophthora cinnamomi]
MAMAKNVFKPTEFIQTTNFGRNEAPAESPSVDLETHGMWLNRGQCSLGELKSIIRVDFDNHVVVYPFISKERYSIGGLDYYCGNGSDETLKWVGKVQVARALSRVGKQQNKAFAPDLTIVAGATRLQLPVSSLYFGSGLDAGAEESLFAICAVELQLFGAGSN